MATTKQFIEQNGLDMKAGAPLRFRPQFLAAAGSTQLGAGAITNHRVIVTVTASTQGVMLPTAATGLEIHVMVPGTKGAKSYPGPNAQIDALSTNAALAIAAGKGNIYYATDLTHWKTIRGA